MHLLILLWLATAHLMSIETFNTRDIKRILNLIKRRNGRSVILGVPRHPSELPEAELILPGHTLLRPSLGMLKSSIKFPQKENNHNVYGNWGNHGLNYGRTKDRVLFTGFRKNTNRAQMKKNKKEDNSREVPYSYNFPDSEPVHPGQTLIRPASGSLQSAFRFPGNRTDGHDVYGNRDSIAMTYGNTDDRVLYTGFRKKSNRDWLVIPILIKPTSNLKGSRFETGDSRSRKNERNPRKPNSFHNQRYKDDWLWNQATNGNHIKTNPVRPQLHRAARRSSKKSKSKFRHRDDETEEKDSDSNGSSSSDAERNSGNPYTIHKNRYIQNWLWNHAMSGDHMNINPYGPQFSNTGPTGSDIFFARKWWYFNQDDYIPFG